MFRSMLVLAASLAMLVTGPVSAQRYSQSVMEVDEKPGYEPSADEERLPAAL